MSSAFSGDQHAGAQLVEQVADAMRQPATGPAERQPGVVDVGLVVRVVVGRGEQVVAEAQGGAAGVVRAQHRGAYTPPVRAREGQFGVRHQGDLGRFQGVDEPPDVEQIGVAAAAACLPVAEQRQVRRAGIPARRLGVRQNRVRALRVRPMIVAGAVRHLVGEQTVVLRNQITQRANHFRCSGAVGYVVDDDVAILLQPGPVDTTFHRSHTRRNDMTIRRHPFLHSENPTGIRTP